MHAALPAAPALGDPRRFSSSATGHYRAFRRSEPAPRSRRRAPPLLLLDDRARLGLFDLEPGAPLNAAHIHQNAIRYIFSIPTPTPYSPISAMARNPIFIERTVSPGEAPDDFAMLRPAYQPATLLSPSIETQWASTAAIAPSRPPHNGTCTVDALQAQQLDGGRLVEPWPLRDNTRTCRVASVLYRNVAVVHCQESTNRKLPVPSADTHEVRAL